ncbi:DUF6126 family protein [Kitasatospora sp. NBC_00240]|uniref:DUF6126 family protein n=1 Tax=Kitasatospora sp. NBC_00240 TaxID=2903567 RepID=UPI002250E1D7|nr:DUF6126 family protein [Kitasatospora sp. NBC_00240]MCX5212895.1 DUF6126 family protein [Kitasatospora sp. NBC_00240]
MTDPAPDAVTEAMAGAGAGAVTEARNNTPGDARNDEKSRRRAMTIRAVIYIAATHLWAGFMILIFTLGKH